MHILDSANKERRNIERKKPLVGDFLQRKDGKLARVCTAGEFYSDTNQVQVCDWSDTGEALNWYLEHFGEQSLPAYWLTHDENKPL